MKTIKEIKHLLEYSELEQINDCLKHYGNILQDIQTPANNRYTHIKYLNKYFGVRMQNGFVLCVSISDINNKEWQIKLI